MDKITHQERETKDLMNVESFSQLPFIRRPAPVPPPVKLEKINGAIRLFGKEFGINNNNNNDAAADDDDDDDDDINKNNINAKSSSEGGGGTFTTRTTGDHQEDNISSSSTSSRKFECHYCCRNFPTSQALGGHQNAHKRERQHAKRAHLQSAMVHAGVGLSSDAHVYGLMNYSSSHHHHHHHRLIGSSSVPLIPYNNNNNNNSWNNTTTTTTSAAYYYNNSRHAQVQQHVQQPINGSPLGLWRIPTTLHTSSSPQIQIPFSSSTSITSQTPKPRSMQDHVSLDLHL